MEVLLNLIYTVQKFKSFSSISLNNDLNYSDFGHYCHFNPFKPNIEILALVVTDQYNVALLIIYLFSSIFSSYPFLHYKQII